MRSFPAFVLSSAVILLALACQTAELSRMQEERVDLEARYSRIEVELERQRALAAVATAERDEARVSGAAARAEAAKMADELAKLAEENIRLAAVLDELQFAKSLQLIPKGPARTPTERSGILVVAVPETDETRYYDAVVNFHTKRGAYLSIRESADGKLKLFAHAAATAMVGDGGEAPLAVDLVVDGERFALPGAVREPSNGGRTETLTLPVDERVFEVVKRVLAARETRLAYHYQGVTRERLITARERSSINNIIYAFRELGGRLP